MRILYLLQDFPYPPIDGIRWKTYSLLSYMARRHECDILSFGDAASAQKAEEWIKSLAGLRVLGLISLPDGWHLRLQQTKHLLKGNPPSLARWESLAFAEAIRQASRYHTYDVVHYDIINMAQYWPLLGGLPGVLSTNDAMAMRYLRAAQVANNLLRRVALRFAASRLAAYETKALRKFTALHVVSQNDANFIVAHNPFTTNVAVISLCVDSSFLKVPLHHPDGNDVYTRKVVLFTAGALQLPHIAEPLQQFAREGLRQIRSVWPNVELHVLGRNAPEKIAKVLMAEPGVCLVPWVEDYIQALAAADITIFLDKAGGGIKTRVLQALAAGKPVVGTSIALEGIAVTNGLNAYVCESLEELTHAVLQLLKDADLRARLGSAARDLVCRHYTQDEIGRQWESLYWQVVEMGCRQSGRVRAATSDSW